MNTRTLAVLAFPLILSPLASAQCQVGNAIRHSAAAPQQYSSFGHRTDLDDDWFIVGAVSQNVGGFDEAGQATFFRKNGASWVRAQTVNSPSASYAGGFGVDVAIDGDRALIGEAYGPGKGEAHIYQRTPEGVWNLAQSITPPDELADTFGVAVDIEGDVLIVGDEDQSDGYGAVYVFRRTAGSFIFEAKLKPPGLTEYSYFGYALDLDPTGTRLAIGAESLDSSLSGTGGAFVYRFNGSAWTLEAQIQPDQVGENYAFGAAIAIDGDRLAVGASQEDVDGLDEAGAAYIFGWNGSFWAYEEPISLNPPSEYMYFGSSIDLSGDRLIVGSPRALNAAGNAITGAAYMFERSPEPGVGWHLSSTINNFGTATAALGYSVSLNGSTVLIGAPSSSTQGNPDVGAVYIVNLSTVAPVITLNPSDRDVNAGEPASFEVGATGGAPLSFQWRLNGQALADSYFPGEINGAYESEITFSEAHGGGGVIDCIITNACGVSVACAPAILIINTPTQCPGDANANGQINFADIISVLANFNTLCP